MTKTRRFIIALCTFLLIGSFSSCSDDDEEEVIVPASTLSVKINDVIAKHFDDMTEFPQRYRPYLTIDKMPEDEKILEVKSFYSYTNTEPDSLDYRYTFSQYAIDMVNNDWDFEEKGPFIWSINAPDITFLPGRKWYVRARVTTNRGVYYSNAKEFDVEAASPLVDAADIRHIPIVFHIFHSANGTYLDKKFFYDALEYANLVYANAWQLSSDYAVDTKICFDLAKTDDNGNVLDEPGLVYEDTYVKISDFEEKEECLKRMWNPRRAINVFVGDISSTLTVYSDSIAGFSCYPIFDQNDLDSIPYAEAYSPEKQLSSFIFFNSLVFNNIGDIMTLAHELGHYLGLAHVFENGTEYNDYCDDTPFYDRENYNEDPDYLFLYRLLYGTDDQYFISTNLMDYYFTFGCAITSDQKKKIDFTLKNAYNVPSPYGKEPELSWEEIKKQYLSDTGSTKSRANGGRKFLP